MIICLDFGSENQGGIARISDEEMFPKCLKSLCVVFKILSPDIFKLSLFIFSIFSALLSARNASDVVVFNSRFPVDCRWFLKIGFNIQVFGDPMHGILVPDPVPWFWDLGIPDWNRACQYAYQIRDKYKPWLFNFHPRWCCALEIVAVCSIFNCSIQFQMVSKWIIHQNSFENATWLYTLVDKSPSSHFHVLPGCSLCVRTGAPFHQGNSAGP